MTVVVLEGWLIDPRNFFGDVVLNEVCPLGVDIARYANYHEDPGGLGRFLADFSHRERSWDVSSRRRLQVNFQSVSGTGPPPPRGSTRATFQSSGRVG